MKTTVKSIILLLLFFTITNNLFSQNKLLTENILISRHLENNLIGSPFLISPNDSCYLLYKNAFYKRLIGKGDTWDRISDDVSMISIDPINPNIFYVINKAQKIVKSMDGGKNWINIENGLPGSLNPIRFLINPHNNSEIFLTTTSGLYKTTDAGFSWQLFKTENGGCQFIINSSDKNKFYVQSSEGIEFSSDAGKSWNIISNTLPKILVSGKGRTAKYKTININIIMYVNFPSSSFLLAYTGKGMFKSTNDGESWIEINNGFSTTDIIRTCFICKNELLLGGGEFNKTKNKYEPIIYRSDIFTSKWKRIRLASDAIESIIGIYKDDSYPGIFIQSDDKIAYADTNQNIIGLNYGVTTHSSIMAFNFSIIDKKKILYAIVQNNNDIDTDRHGLWKSTNEGISWEKCMIYSNGVYGTGQGMVNIVVSPYNPSEIWSFDYDNWNHFNYASSDGGVIWNSINTKYNINVSVLDFAFDQSDPNTIYYTTGGGILNKYSKVTLGSTNIHEPSYTFKIAKDNNKNILTKDYYSTYYISNDGGWTWSKICDSRYVIPALSYNSSTLVYYSKDSIIISAYNSLFISTDTGKNWRVMKTFDGEIKSVYISPEDANNIFVTLNLPSNKNTILQTTDGIRWDPLTPGYSGSFIIKDAANNILYLYGSDGIYSINGINYIWNILGGIHENN